MVTVWIGTAGGGLCAWQNDEITRFPVGASDSANFVFSIAPRPDGGAWLSASEGEELYEYLNGQDSKSFVGCARNQIDFTGSSRADVAGT